MRILVLTATLLALAGPPALAQSNVPEIGIRSYWREDIALESILSPPDTVYVGDTIYPAVMGMNFDMGSRSSYLTCIIDNCLDAVVYASIQGFTAPSRDSFIVTFAVPWIAQVPGDYYVRFSFSSRPPRDRWPENDSISKHFVVLPREGGLDGSGPESELRSARDEDIGLLRIPLPPDTIHVGDSIHVSLEGMNYGISARHVFMVFAIDDGLDRVVYATTFGITVPARDSFVVSFAVPWVALQPGEFFVSFWLARHDHWPENDSISKKVVVLPREGGVEGQTEACIALSLFEYVDVGFDTILSPPDTVWIGECYYPCVRMVNYGNEAEYAYVCFTLADLSDSIIYRTMQGVSIPGYDSLELHYAGIEFGRPPPGRYLLTWWHTRTDSNPSNDTISRIVHVLYPVGLASQQPGTQGSTTPLLVRPSIVRVGGMISVSGLGPGVRAELIDAAGRVKGHLAPGSTAIAAPCLPGVYFIRREEDDRTTRVLVQP